jgi:hypothetical protein
VNPLISTVHILGERNSGTNWLEKMVAANFTGITTTAAGKHLILLSAELQSASRDPGTESVDLLSINAPHNVLVIIIFKNVLAWISSMRNKPYCAYDHVSIKNAGHYQCWERLGMGEFLRKEWRDYTGPEQNKKIAFKIANIIQLRNFKNRIFLSLKERAPNIELVQYEDLLKDPHKVLAGIAKKYNIGVKEPFDIFANDKLIGKFPTKEGQPGQIENIRNDYLRKYMDNPSYLSEFNGDDLQFIRGELNFSLEEAIGYSYTF